MVFAAGQWVSDSEIVCVDVYFIEEQKILHFVQFTQSIDDELVILTSIWMCNIT